MSDAVIFLLWGWLIWSLWLSDWCWIYCPPHFHRSLSKGIVEIHPLYVSTYGLTRKGRKIKHQSMTDNSCSRQFTLILILSITLLQICSLYVISAFSSLCTCRCGFAKPCVAPTVQHGLPRERHVVPNTVEAMKRKEAEMKSVARGCFWI